MASIIIDETEFIEAMKKLKVEVSRDQDAYRLCNSGEAASRENKISAMVLKYRRMGGRADGYIKKI